MRAIVIHAAKDLRGEELVAIAQTLGVPLGLELPAGMATRPALLLPATRWTLGWPDDHSFVLDIERGHEPVQVPEFEIDAQAVTWAQYVEFIADGGYDREELWHPRGWLWLQREAGEAARTEYARFDARRREFRALLLDTRRALQRVYDTPEAKAKDWSAVEPKKAAAMAEFRQRYAALRESR